MRRTQALRRRAMALLLGDSSTAVWEFWLSPNFGGGQLNQLFGLASPNLHIPPTTSIPTVGLLHLGREGVAPLLEEMHPRAFQLFFGSFIVDWCG